MESTTKLYFSVASDYTWYSKVTCDMLVKAPHNGFRCLIHKSKGFNPFGIYVYANKDELFPSPSPFGRNLVSRSMHRVDSGKMSLWVE